jgi:hypothetical protein
MAMNGELLQAANYLCNKGLTFLEKLRPGHGHQPLDLDPPFLVVGSGRSLFFSAI